MLYVHISRVRCTGLAPGSYCVKIQDRSPRSKEHKSDYVKRQNAALEWSQPFKDRRIFVGRDTGGAPLKFTLRQHHRWPKRSEDAGTCEIVFSAEETSYTGVLVSSNNVEVGRLELTAEAKLEGIATLGDRVNSVLDAMTQARNVPALPDSSNSIPTLALPDPWVTLRDRLKALDPIVSAVDELAKVHPWVTLAWEVVTVAYKVMKAQMERDEKIEALVQTMSDCCDITEHAEKLRDYTTHFNAVFEKILHQVMECAYFIRDYANKSFGVRIIDDTLSPAINDQIETFRLEFERLRKILSDYAVAHCELQVYRVLNVAQDVLKVIQENIAMTALSEMQYSANAHPDLTAGCLDGTRVEIIDAIVRWAGGIDISEFDAADHLVSHHDRSGTAASSMPPIDPSARVLWLCGLAGAGKSSIARSVAARIRDRGRLGCIYAFSSKFADTNPSNLFSTIARDLADLDPTRKQELVKIVKDKTSLRQSTDCSEQFKQFIVQASKNVPTIGELLIIIDAFDESGDPNAREDILSILTQSAHMLPAGTRVLVTSRAEHDVLGALELPLYHLTWVHMENLPSTSRDISIFVMRNLSRLGLPNNLVDQLVRKAETSFQWASTACRYIQDRRTGGRRPLERLNDILQSDKGLDALYTTILNREFPHSDQIARERLRLVLGQILCAQEPLTRESLAALAPADVADPLLLQDILQHLGSLLSGTHEDHAPVAPLHSSLRDFLCDERRSSGYHVDLQAASELMAIACLDLLLRALKFNMCQFPTSFKANHDVPELEKLKEEHIPHHVQYACWYWATHVYALKAIGKSLQARILALLQDQYLHWLEVMSVCSRSPQSALALLQLKTTVSELDTAIRDAMQFATMFATPISQSAPHIYLSALAFAPESSDLHKQVSRHHGMLELVRGRLHDWPRLIHILHGHTESVRSVAFSPDGTRIASGTDDGTILLWDVNTANTIGKPLVGHASNVTSVAFSPDGAHIASGSYDYSVRLWDAKTGDAIGDPLEGHTDFIRSVTFSPDGSRIASASEDKTIRLWDVATRKPTRNPLAGHTAWVNSVVFSPDGKRIASGAEDWTVRLWDADTGDAILEPLIGHTYEVYSVTFCPNGACVASASMEICLWDVSTGELIGKPFGPDSTCTYSIAFSPDSKHIVSGSIDNTVCLWDVDTGQRSGEPLAGHTGSVRSVTFSPDGARIASGSDDKSVRIWDATSGDTAGTSHVGHSKGVNAVAFSPDGARIASGANDQTIRLWDAKTGAAIGSSLAGHTDAVQSVAFSPDGTRVASGSDDETVRLWDANKGEAIGNPFTGNTHGVDSIAFSPDGSRIASGSNDGHIRIWDTRTGDAVGGPLEGYTRFVRSVAFSPDGAHIVSGSSDNTIRLCDALTGIATGSPFTGHTGPVTSVACSPDVLHIASGSWDSTVRLWDAKTGTPIGEPFTGHTGSVYSVAFSPDGERIASGSRDTTVRLWDAKTGEAIGKPLLGHSEPVNSVAFSPDGKYIVSGSSDRTIRIWDLEMCEERRESRQSLTTGIPQRLQYPPELFPPGTFRMDDGWIRGPNGELYVWIPPAHRFGLQNPKNCLIMSADHVTELDFSKSKCGKLWADICKENRI